jgi:hypothetical protein
MPQDNPRSQTSRAETSRGESARFEHDEISRPETFRTASSSAGDATQGRFAEMGLKNVRTGLRMQKEMFDTLQDIGRDWLQRAATEAELAYKLPGRLRDARSVPDALSAYQHWLREWLDLCGEDGRRFMSDGQKIVNTGVRCLSSAALQ